MTGLTITTIATHTCKECLASFPSAFALTQHECRALFAIPDTDVVDSKGWRPLHIPLINPIPRAWRIYTDGSGGQQSSNTAGWGFAVYDANDTDMQHALFEIYGPVMLDTSDQRYIGATQATNNTAELTAIAEAFTWLNTEAPGDPRVPAYIHFDSQYAAEATQGISDGQSNQTLIQHCQAQYNTCKQTRKIGWQWVKGHTGQAGNELADKLAEKGSQGQVSTHSHRWAAPHHMALTQENAERCRKCGRLFRDARKCAAHEKGCDGENEVLGTEQLCRKCGLQFKDRKHHLSQCLWGEKRRKPCPFKRQIKTFSSETKRIPEEIKCTGNALDNLKCKFCGKFFVIMSKRIQHEGSCTKRPHSGLEGNIFWQCPCGCQIEKGTTTPKNSKTKTKDTKATVEGP